MDLDLTKSLEQLYGAPLWAPYYRILRARTSSLLGAG